MRKIFNKILSFLLVLTMLLLATVACGINDDSNDVDDTKTQLNVGNMYAGFRDNWLQIWKKEFEELYADTSFEPGKKGVQIWIDNQREAYEGKTLLSSISAYNQDIYFTEEAYLYDYVAQNACADITDIVTEDLSTLYSGETGSIENKMRDSLSSYYKINNKYYMLPLNESYFGITYDIDLFIEKSFYISNNSTSTLTKFTNDKTKFSNGPDGVVGTDDDGLPATYIQFYDLLNKMKNSDVTPFIWAGKFHSTYGNRFVCALQTDASGYDEEMLNFTLSGTSSTLVDSILEKTKQYGDSNYDISTITLGAPVVIDENNAVELQKQAGRFYATQFTANLIKDESNYDSQSFSGATTHTGAQTEFLYSSYNHEKNSIAMLIDGSWWRAEAKSTFDNMVTSYGEEASMNSRNFGFMPLPKPTEDLIGKDVYYSENNTCCFVSSYCSQNKFEVAKKFLQFCFTNKSIQNYTQCTDTTMPYDYGFNANEESEYVDKLTTFGKSMWNIHKEGNIVYNVSSNSKYIQNYSYFSEDWNFSSKYNGGQGRYLFTVFHNNSKLSVKDYFNGLYSYHSDSNLWK